MAGNKRIPSDTDLQTVEDKLLCTMVESGEDSFTWLQLVLQSLQVCDRRYICLLACMPSASSWYLVAALCIDERSIEGGTHNGGAVSAAQ